MSEYFTAPADVISGLRARSTKINALITATEAGFDSLPVDLSGYMTELENARDSFSTLLAKQEDQDTRIAALGGNPIALEILSQGTLKKYFLL